MKKTIFGGGPADPVRAAAAWSDAAGSALKFKFLDEWNLIWLSGQVEMITSVK